MSQINKYPDFFIVGAPKSGTTALDDFLNQHPEIFMAKKELHYFGSDLGIKQKNITESTYLSYFSNAKNTQIKGESSVWYLYSTTAAKEIKEANPESKIIIILRKPYEMIPSLHSQFIFNCDETETNFKNAFLSNLNKKGNINAPSFSFNNRPSYINSVLYYEQVKRYYAVFGEKNVLILLHNELQNNFDSTYNNILNFLGVNKNFTPQKESINARRSFKSTKIHHASKNPPNQLKKIVRFLVPIKTVRHSLMKYLDKINISKQKKNVLSSELKNKIIALTQTDIKKLSNLIGKDLTFWIK